MAAVSFDDGDDDDHMNPVKKKGCIAIKVGGEGEEKQRFIIPVMYLNHPLFVHLLKEAEEEYGFQHKGPITIPCHVDHFRHVRGIIDQDLKNINNPHLHLHHHLHLPCFRV